MALQFDQLNNQLKTNDSTNANASLTLTPSGTGAVLLNGTGENLITNSNTFANWAIQNVTLTANATVAPDGASTATNMLADGTSNLHGVVSPSWSVISGVTYTASGYFKANTNNFVQIRSQSSIGAAYANFNVSTGVVGSTNLVVSTAVTSVGNGWYRCSITFVSTATISAGVAFYIVTSNTATGAESNTLTTAVYLWGSQVEIGSTANTYIATTTTAIYGTPTLSFSGVAGLGLQSDGSLYVSPAGTGALQAQATTSSTVGGNARGANAVDWQTARNAASQVASATQSFLGGGYANAATATTSVVVGGSGNSVTSQDGFVGSGSGNIVSGFRSSIVGGQSNTAAGYLNFIGGGFTNSGTAAAAVTTQSGTMNATTAVTLSGSNASIKVGQYITGTSIAADTYVAAISGTSLTLSKVASGSSTSTLSFYTPHGVVVGGGNNQATGSYSFIGGGGDAGTSANRNVASGDWSVVCGGRTNVASGFQSVVLGGSGNTSSGINNTIGGGLNNQATGPSYSLVTGGVANISNSSAATVNGGFHGNTRGINGYSAFPSCYIPVANSNGVSQAGLLILGRQTTDATATVLASDTAAAGTTNQVILPNNSAYYFKASIISGVTGAGNSKAWTIEGAIKRGANAAATSIVGVVTTVLAQDSGASTWAISATADTTNGGLAITFTGQAATTIRVVAKVETTELTY